MSFCIGSRSDISIELNHDNVEAFKDRARADRSTTFLDRLLAPSINPRPAMASKASDTSG